MSSTFTGLRCSDCMGNLEYDKARKIWVCPYCGKEYERDLHVDKVQIDGVAGTNDVVRATLSDISKYDFVSAGKNLSECEKINPNHVGTIISNICYYLFSAAQKPKNLQQQDVAKVTYYAKKLSEEYAEVYQDETKLYDYLNNPDLYAVLYITFNSIGNKQREEIIYKYLTISSIVDPKLNKSLLTISIKKNLLEDVDIIVNKLDFIDKKSTLYEILKRYPDGSKKKEYIKLLLHANAFTSKDEPLIQNYIKTTTDSVDTRFTVLSIAYTLGIPLNLTQILTEIFNNCTTEDSAKSIFESLEEIKLKRDDVQIVLDYCLSKNCPNDEVAIIGLNYLKDSNSLFEVDDNDIVTFLAGEAFTNEEKIHIVEVMLEKFNVSSKSLDAITTYLLLNCKFPLNERLEIIKLVFTHVKSITIKTLEDYILTTNIDKENKPEIVKLILELGMNKAYFSNLLSRYMNSNVDEPKVKTEITFILMDNGLRCESSDLTNMLLGYKDNNVTSTLLERLKNYPVKPEPETLMRYFKSKNSLANYDQQLVSYLLRFKVVSDGMCIEKYLLTSNDVIQQKVNITMTLLNNCINKNFSSQIAFIHNNANIKGNLAQAYLLSSTDDTGSKLTIIKQLLSYMKLSEPMTVNGKQIKFKKYITENKNNLDKEIDKLCEELGVYKLFF